MDIGIAFPSYIDAWREVQAAEEAGFTHAWFFDSQLIYSDVYATMALAAQHTSRIRLGTLVAIPTNRIAPVTASAIATINKLAPGRVTLAMGTGYTGRQGVFELVKVDDSIRDMILHREGANRIKKYCIEKGMVSLREQGWDCVRNGVTTPEEIVRITKADKF